MNAKSVDGSPLDEEGNEILFPVASDINGAAMEADRGLRRFLIKIREEIKKDDKHFKEETFADIFAFLETGQIIFDDEDHFKDPLQAAMSTFSIISVGAALFLLNSFSEQRGKKQAEFRHALKMYVEFEKDRLENKKPDETPEERLERRKVALGKLAEKMRHSGLQFVNLPLRDKAFPHAEFMEIAKNHGIGEPLLMATINNVRNFCTSSDKRIEISMSAASMLSYRTTQLGFAIGNTFTHVLDLTDTAVEKLTAFATAPLTEKAKEIRHAYTIFNLYVSAAGNPAAVPVALTVDTIRNAGNAVSQTNRNPSSMLDLIEDRAVETTREAGHIILQYIENAILFRRKVPPIIREGLRESKSFRERQQEKQKAQSTQHMREVEIINFALKDPELAREIKARLDEISTKDLEELKEHIAEVIKDTDRHEQSAKLARTSFLAQYAFMLAQGAVLGIKILEILRTGNTDYTATYNIWSAAASVGPLEGFKDQLKREHDLLQSKTVMLADKLAKILGIPSDTEETAPPATEQEAPAPA